MSPCPYCQAPEGHSGLNECPETGSRLPRQVRPATPDRQVPNRDAQGGQHAKGTDPFAAFEKPWRLEIQGRETLGLDEGEALMLGRNDGTPISSWCSKYISSRHVEFRVLEGSLLVTDLNSTNGTFLNGKQLASKEARKCKDGDSVRLATKEAIVIEVRDNQ